LTRLPGQKLVVPGNHDVPLSAVMGRPFARFAHYFPDLPLYLESPDAFVIGFNTAFGSRLADWSLGAAGQARVAPVAALLREKRHGRLGIVACHHPLLPHALDIRRSTTARGPEAFDELAAAGMNLLLHGHLHRTSKSCVPVAGSPVCELCANTALSDRERAGAAGYNIIDITGPDYTVTAISWDGAHYALSLTL
jgi:3',5'-cyclic AMP phosphodiesterase CpdA